MKKIAISLIVLVISIIGYLGSNIQGTTQQSLINISHQQSDLNQSTANKVIENSLPNSSSNTQPISEESSAAKLQTTQDIFNNIYDTKSGSIHLHALSQAINAGEFSNLVQLLTFDNGTSIEFSTTMQQTLQDTLLIESTGYVDGIGCYKTMCLAEITTIDKLTDAQKTSILTNIKMRNLVLNTKMDNGEYVYQFAFTSDKNAGVIVGPSAN